jgi:hypothetical protein
MCGSRTESEVLGLKSRCVPYNECTDNVVDRGATLTMCAGNCGKPSRPKEKCSHSQRLAIATEHLVGGLTWRPMQGRNMGIL